MTCHEYWLFAYLVPQLEHLPCVVRYLTLAVALAVDAEVTEYLPTVVRLINDGIPTVIHVLVCVFAVCVAAYASFVSLAYLAHSV